MLFERTSSRVELLVSITSLYIPSNSARAGVVNTFELLSMLLRTFWRAGDTFTYFGNAEARGPWPEGKDLQLNGRIFYYVTTCWGMPLAWVSYMTIGFQFNLGLWGTLKIVVNSCGLGGLCWSIREIGKISIFQGG
jgi:hypothetical protein